MLDLMIHLNLIISYSKLIGFNTGYSLFIYIYIHIYILG